MKVRILMVILAVLVFGASQAIPAMRAKVGAQTKSAIECLEDGSLQLGTDDEPRQAAVLPLLSNIHYHRFVRGYSSISSAPFTVHRSAKTYVLFRVLRN